MKSIYSLRSLIVLGCLLLSGSAFAQMVGTDIFLKGKYLELGIADQGWFGTTSSPAGYHPHTGGVSTALGYVADPDMDGWAVGTPPYYGDFFIPGTPFEGWELQINGNRCSAYNPSGIVLGGLTGTGANLSYTTSGTKVIATWQGIFDSVQMTQETTLDTNNLYYMTKVTLTNLAVAPKDNIYYLRTLDPDNDETQPGGSFVTTNVIRHQSTDTTVVSATALAHPNAYFALGTTDTAATALIYNSWPLSITVDLSTLYNGTYGTAYYAPGDSVTLDVAIGLVIKVAHLATVDSALDSVYRTTSTYSLHPANSHSFTFFGSFSKAATDSAIKASNTPAITHTLGINNVNNSAEVKVYPNPSTGVVNITGLTITDRVTVYDMMGRDANQNWSVRNEGTNTFRYNLPSGAYVIIITDATGNVKARVPVRKQ